MTTLEWLILCGVCLLVGVMMGYGCGWVDARAMFSRRQQ